MPVISASSYEAFKLITSELRAERTVFISDGQLTSVTAGSALVITADLGTKPATFDEDFPHAVVLPERITSS